MGRPKQRSSSGSTRFFMLVYESQASEMETVASGQGGHSSGAELSDLSFTWVRTAALTFLEQLCKVNSLVLNR